MSTDIKRQRLQDKVVEIDKDIRQANDSLNSLYTERARTVEDLAKIPRVLTQEDKANIIYAYNRLKHLEVGANLEWMLTLKGLGE